MRNTAASQPIAGHEATAQMTGQIMEGKTWRAGGSGNEARHRPTATSSTTTG